MSSPMAHGCFSDGRNMAGCRDEFGTYAHGSKGSAVISTLGHTPGMTRIYKGQQMPRLNSRKELPVARRPEPGLVVPAA